VPSQFGGAVHSDFAAHGPWPGASPSPPSRAPQPTSSLPSPPPQHPSSSPLKHTHSSHTFVPLSRNRKPLDIQFSDAEDFFVCCHSTTNVHCRQKPLSISLAARGNLSHPSQKQYSSAVNILQPRQPFPSTAAVFQPSGKSNPRLSASIA
jgi:hypothetical protein